MQLDVISIIVGVAIGFVGIPATVAVVRCVAKRIAKLYGRRGHCVIRDKKRGALAAVLARAQSWVDEATPTSATRAMLRSLSLKDLQKVLRSQQLSAVEVLRAYMVNALEAHRKTNCISWVMLDDAIANAVAADKLFADGDATVLDALPLLGIPVSIKEMVAYKGTDCTLGLIGKAFAPTNDDSGSVTLLRGHGANIFVKTSVPVLLLSYECESALFGITTNPYDARRTPGGSSGGEGALLALHGAAVGVGTDIGGSIRIPAALCGIVGLKPTFLRISTRNNRAIRGDESIPSITGPMGRSVGDVVALFASLAARPDGALVDGMASQIPFNAARYHGTLSKKVLRIGYYEQDGLVDTSPACARAVRVAVAALHAAGHEVVAFTPPMVLETISVFYELLGADGTRTLSNLLGSDEAFGVVKPLLTFAALPSWIRPLASFVISKTVCPIYASILSRAIEKRVDEYGATLIRRNNCRHAYADLFTSLGLDAVICPGFYTPAPLCGATTNNSFGAAMTAYYNAMDLPVVTIPTAVVEPQLDEWTSAPSNGMSRAIQRTYDAKEMAGLPVGIQIVTPKLTEEVTLAIAERIEGLLKK